MSEPGAGTGVQRCVCCEELNDLLHLVAELKEEMERLGSIRESEGDIEWWSYTNEHSMGGKQEELGAVVLLQEGCGMAAPWKVGDDSLDCSLQWVASCSAEGTGEAGQVERWLCT